MIYLKKIFKKKGIEFSQLWKDENVVIYQLEQQSQTNPNEHSKWYEVFKPYEHKADIYHDDEYEKYPSDEDFGRWAWSCESIKSVEKILLKHFEKSDVDMITTYLMSGFVGR